VILEDSAELRRTIAIACRLLSTKGLVDGILGHVSARVADDEILIRCRAGTRELGLSRTTADDVWRVKMDGAAVDMPDGYDPPRELSIHTETLRRRPEFGSVVHAHPPSALVAGLAGLQPRPVFGSYNMPAMRLAMRGIPVYERPILITRPELAAEMLDAMGDADVCLMRGHGITVGAATVEQATILAINLTVLLDVTVQLAKLGADPPDVSDADVAELPDLGSAFNDQLVWQALVAELDGSLQSVDPRRPV
jgi:ribulose-5-phosphate 4-epimerase/fuculose-1-phosphate aldolase